MQLKCTSSKLQALILWTMLLALAVSNVLLLRQNLRLRAELYQLGPDFLLPGDKVPSFSAKGLRDDQVEVKFSGQGGKRVLLFFTPTCPYCRVQFYYWRELIERADQERFEIIGMVGSSEDEGKVEEYLRSVNCAVGSSATLRVALAPAGVRRVYKLSATSTTLIVANDGTVEKVWSGLWSAEMLAEANSIFGFEFSTKLKDAHASVNSR